MKIIPSVIALTIVITGCAKLDEPEIYIIELPYPPDEDILYYQSEADSGYQEWWRDIEAVASAFLNNSQYRYRDVKPQDIIVVSEGIFHGLIEVKFPDMVLELTMERKFKSRGRKSIWQVVAVEEKPWDKQDSK